LKEESLVTSIDIPNSKECDWDLFPFFGETVQKWVLVEDFLSFGELIGMHHIVVSIIFSLSQPSQILAWDTFAVSATIFGVGKGPILITETIVRVILLY